MATVKVGGESQQELSPPGFVVLATVRPPLSPFVTDCVRVSLFNLFHRDLLLFLATTIHEDVLCPHIATRLAVRPPRSARGTLESKTALMNYNWATLSELVYKWIDDGWTFRLIIYEAL